MRCGATRANGRVLRNYLDWEAVKLDLRVGDEVRVTLKRGGKEESHRLTTGDLPTSTATKVTVLKGLEVVTVTPAIQGERGLRSSKGALIVRVTDEVRRGTALQEGDVILSMDGTPAGNVPQFDDMSVAVVRVL